MASSFCLDGEMNKRLSSCSTINSLPLEILLEILYLLPVKELHRNKTVCKLWSSIISHPSFGFQYSVRSRIRPSSHYTLYLSFDHHCSNNYEKEGWSMDSPRLSLDFLYNQIEKHLQKFCRVLASSKGLLLCTNTYDSSEVTYYVLNPLTKQSHNLPSPPTSSEIVLSGIVCFESSNQTQFKVVRIVRDANFRVSNVLDIEIFESTTNQWRILRTEVDSKIAFDSGNVVEHRGILYWVIDRRDSVLNFNPNNDLCLQFSLPETYVYFGSQLGVSQDHLYYMKIEFLTPNTTPCTIWRCDQYEGEYTWSVHRSLDLDWIHQHLILKRSNFNQNTMLAIDPMDCNILYVSEWGKISKKFSCLYHVYTLDIAKREMSLLCSHASFISHDPIIFIEPTWPTSLPKLPA